MERASGQQAPATQGNNSAADGALPAANMDSATPTQIQQGQPMRTQTTTQVLSLSSDPPPPSAFPSVATVTTTNRPPAVTMAPPSTSLSPSTSAVLPPQPTLPVPCLTQNTPGEASDGGLLLSPALEVIPKKLVEKIRAGKFIEMKELLQDNISLAAQLQELQQGSSSLQVIGAVRARLHPSPPGVIASSRTLRPQHQTQSLGSNWHI